ncbi:MAG: isoprenylcysteine carboxylmethyltransferase family protein [Woeseiaceae bacterium]
MLTLELKVPPLLLALLCGAAMWGITRLTPGFELPVLLRAVTCLLLASIGFAVIVAGAMSFRRAGTTVNPTKPESSSALVSDGIYRFTRNPMYVGMLLWLAAFGVWLANGFAFTVCVFFILYMNRFQIGPEERALQATFGESYLAYTKRVRRWL